MNEVISIKHIVINQW